MGAGVRGHCAERCRGCPAADIPAFGRIGDDEFLVLLRDVEPERLSEKKAQEFYTALGTLFSARGDERYKPTCSVGIARYPMDGTLFETVFQSADAALHEAKRLGLNRVAFAPGCEGRKR